MSSSFEPTPAPPLLPSPSSLESVSSKPAVVLTSTPKNKGVEDPRLASIASESMSRPPLIEEDLQGRVSYGAIAKKQKMDEVAVKNLHLQGRPIAGSTTQEAALQDAYKALVIDLRAYTDAHLKEGALLVQVWGLMERKP